MTYHFKQPNTFKPAYKSAMLYTKAYSERILHFNQLSDAEAFMEQLRYFRWCCRHPNSTDPEMRQIEAEYSIRAKLQSDGTVKLVCKPKRLSMLIALNPWVEQLPIETV